MNEGGERENMFDFLFILLQVVILDGILSIDNAAALGAIASKLPVKAKAPLPKSLHWLGTTQREAALKVGILGAYVGRGLMLLITGIVIQYPILKIVGAAYLLWLVYGYFKDVFFPAAEGEEGESRFAKNANNFWKAVVMIELADLAFSIDNVVAVVALSSQLWIIILGVFISIVIMRFAAVLFIKLLAFEPLLEHAAYCLIAAIAIELVLKFFGVGISEIMQFSISMGILLLFVLYGQIGRRIGFVASVEAAKGGE